MSIAPLLACVFAVAVPVAFVLPDVPYDAECVKDCMGAATYDEGERLFWEAGFESFYETDVGQALEQEFTEGGVWESEWEEAGALFDNWCAEVGFSHGGTTATNWVECRMKCTTW